MGGGNDKQGSKVHHSSVIGNFNFEFGSEASPVDGLSYKTVFQSKACGCLPPTVNSPPYRQLSVQGRPFLKGSSLFMSCVKSSFRHIRWREEPSDKERFVR